MSAQTNFFVGGEPPRSPRSFSDYLSAIEELEDLRDLWVTLSKHAPRNRHTAAGRARIKRRAAELHQMVEQFETPPRPAGE